MTIASMNPDALREMATRREIVKGLAGNRIHIAAIHETHITQDKSYVVDNYRIITAASDKNETDGIVTGRTSIVIRESPRKHFAKITRRNGRPLRVTLDRAERKIPIRIISTYAPCNGHTEAEKQHRWEDVKVLLN